VYLRLEGLKKWVTPLSLLQKLCRALMVELGTLNWHTLLCLRWDAGDVRGVEVDDES
jgi:hypothetical protein